MANTDVGIRLTAETLGEDRLKAMADAINKLAASATQQTKPGGSGADPNAEFQKLGASIKQFITDPLGSAGSAAESFVNKLGPIGIGIGVVAGAALSAGAAILSAARSMGQAAEQALNISLTTGLTTREVKQFQVAAELTGQTVDIFETGMRKLSQAMAGAGETGAKGRAALEQIGFTLYNTDGALKSTKQTWLDLADAIMRVEDPQKRYLAATEIFGRGAAGILHTLRELRQNVGWAEGIGLGMDEEKAKKLDDIGDTLEKIDTLWESLKKKDKISLVLGIKATIENISGYLGGELKQGRGAGAAAMRLLTPAGLLAFATAGAMAEDQSAGSGSNAANTAPVRGWLNPGGADTIGLDRIAILKREAKEFDELISESRKKLAGVADEGSYRLEEQNLTRLIAGQKSITDEIERTTEARKKSKEEAEKLAKFLDERRQKETQAVLGLVGFGIGGPAIPGANAIQAMTRGGAGISPLQNLLGGIEGGGVLWDWRYNAPQKGAAALPEMTPGGEFGMFGLNRLPDDKSLTNQLAAQRLMVDLQTRRIELMAGPGGELAALKQITALRLQSLNVEVTLGMDGEEAARRRMEIEEESQLRILEYQKQRRDQSRAEGQSMFDALTRGGASARQYLLGLPLGFGRTMFGNAYSELMTRTDGKLSLTNDPNSMLGRILQGTPFGADPMRAAGTVQMTAAQMQIRAATMQQAAAGRAGLGAFSGIGSTRGWDQFLGAMGSSVPVDPLQLQRGWDPHLGMMGAGLPKAGGWGLGKTMGAGALIAGGAFGAYSGYSAGGAQGALTGTASIAGAAGGLLAMLGDSLSMAGPIGMGVGMALGVAAMLMGDPKEKRRKELEAEAEARRTSLKSGQEYAYDTYGRALDYDSRGGVRVYIANLNALDAQNIVDRQQDIGEAVRQAMTSYPPLAVDVRAAVFEG